MLGKRVIRSQDRAGFIVNALFVPYVLSAIRMLESGFASAEDIDAGMVEGCSHPMGPLALADMIGLDTIEAVADSMYAEFKEPLYAPPPLLSRMVEAGPARPQVRARASSTTPSNRPRRHASARMSESSRPRRVAPRRRGAAASQPAAAQPAVDRAARASWPTSPGDSPADPVGEGRRRHRQREGVRRGRRRVGVHRGRRRRRSSSAGIRRRTRRAGRRSRGPVIAAINGFALGGGLSSRWPATCASPATRRASGFPRSSSASSPAVAAPSARPGSSGPARTKELIWSGRHVRADEALTIGLVDRVVPRRGDVRRRAGVGTAFAAGAVVAMGIAKRVIDGGLDGSLAAGLDLEAEGFVEVFATDDARGRHPQLPRPRPRQGDLHRLLTRPPHPFGASGA